MARDRSTEELVLLQAKVPKSLRDAFMRVVKDADDNASRLIRSWVREYLRKAQTERPQADLFAKSSERET
jgi:hypothetical protein